MQKLNFIVLSIAFCAVTACGTAKFRSTNKSVNDRTSDKGDSNSDDAERKNKDLGAKNSGESISVEDIDDEIPGDEKIDPSPVPSIEPSVVDTAVPSNSPAVTPIVSAEPQTCSKNNPSAINVEKYNLVEKSEVIKAIYQPTHQRILVLNYNRYINVRAFKNDLSPDTSFGKNGTLITNYQSAADITVDNDGRIYLAIDDVLKDRTRDSLIDRYSADGKTFDSYTAGMKPLDGGATMTRDANGNPVYKPINPYFLIRRVHVTDENYTYVNYFKTPQNFAGAISVIAPNGTLRDKIYPNPASVTSGVEACSDASALDAQDRLFTATKCETSGGRMLIWDKNSTALSSFSTMMRRIDKLNFAANGDFEVRGLARSATTAKTNNTASYYNVNGSFLGQRLIENTLFVSAVINNKFLSTEYDRFYVYKDPRNAALSRKDYLFTDQLASTNGTTVDSQYCWTVPQDKSVSVPNFKTVFVTSDGQKISVAKVGYTVTGATGQSESGTLLLSK